MSGNTTIEWTERTWNPLTGCTKVSPGCDHCYAKTMHERFNGPGSFDTVKLHPERLHDPIRWRKPGLVFVNSMSDLFHDDVPDDFIAQVFHTMRMAYRQTFQLLTKRHARMRSLLNSDDFKERVWELGGVGGRFGARYDHFRTWPTPNVWLGVSVEDQKWADIRIPALLDTPAAVRFLSCEPLLGPVNLDPWRNAGELWNGKSPADARIDWVIAGGESGRGARPMHPDWVRSLRDQCTAGGVPFLFKQWGAWTPSLHGTHRVTFGGEHYPNEGRSCPMSAEELVSRVGKKAAGRLLDGRTWDEYPVGVTQTKEAS